MLKQCFHMITSKEYQYLFAIDGKENKEKYDLLLIKDFNSLHWRTAKFCHRRNQLGLPIYSLKEGYLPYKKESDVYEI